MALSLTGLLERLALNPLLKFFESLLAVKPLLALKPLLAVDSLLAVGSLLAVESLLAVGFLLAVESLLAVPLLAVDLLLAVGFLLAVELLNIGGPFSVRLGPREQYLDLRRNVQRSLKVTDSQDICDL